MIKQANKYSLDEVLNPSNFKQNNTKNVEIPKTKIQNEVSDLLDSVHQTVGVVAFEKLNEIEIPRISLKISEKIKDQNFNK